MRCEALPRRILLSPQEENVWGIDVEPACFTKRQQNCIDLTELPDISIYVVQTKTTSLKSLGQQEWRIESQQNKKFQRVSMYPTLIEMKAVQKKTCWLCVSWKCIEREQRVRSGKKSQILGRPKDCLNHKRKEWELS